MKLSDKQQTRLGEFFTDIAKAIITVYVIGGLIPAANIPRSYIAAGFFTAVFISIAGLILIDGEKL